MYTVVLTGNGAPPVQFSFKWLRQIRREKKGEGSWRRKGKRRENEMMLGEGHQISGLVL